MSRNRGSGMRFWQGGPRGRALADDLLARLEPLTRDARVRELVALGRASGDDNAARPGPDAPGRGARACAVAGRPRAPVHHRPRAGTGAAAVVDLVLRSADQVWLPLDRAGPRLDIERLRALLARLPTAHGAVQNRFRHLRPDVRAALFAEFGVGWRDGLGCMGCDTARVAFFVAPAGSAAPPGPAGLGDPSAAAPALRWAAALGGGAHRHRATRRALSLARQAQPARF